MKVKDLIKELSEQPGDLEVHIYGYEKYNDQSDKVYYPNTIESFKLEDKDPFVVIWANQ